MIKLRDPQEKGEKKAYTCTPLQARTRDTKHNEAVTSLEWSLQARVPPLFTCVLYANASDRQRQKQPRPFVTQRHHWGVRADLQASHRGSCRPPVSLSSCVDAHLCWWRRWGSAPLRCSLQRRQRELVTDGRTDGCGGSARLSSAPLVNCSSP